MTAMAEKSPDLKPDLKADAERPWLGLLPFSEAAQRYFFGRDQEIRDGFLRVREHPLTVLYGPSGLGKSSLLGAGLIPKLRVEGYRPALIRLRYEEGAPTLLAQVEGTLSALLQSGNEAAVRSPAPTLWERFHHVPTRPPDLASAPPVLLFDQFEEIFTLTEPSPIRRSEAEALFHQLADLIENRPPAALQESLRAQRELARDLDFAASPVRVVLTLREDYLSHLEAWKKTLPALMRNRMGLRLLNGPNALAAVVEPGRLGGQELVSRDVGERIVCFVARRPTGTPLAEISAVPPLLSLLCYELNEARLAPPGAAAISAEQVDRQAADILQNFYDRSFAGLDPAVRGYVEDRMITVGGHRNAVAREDAVAALREAGVKEPEAALDQLVNGRLLAAEDLGGLKRLEITHDVLAPLAVRSREQRRERERAERAETEEREAKAREAAARRQRARLRWLAVTMSALALAALTFAFLAFITNRQATSLLEEASRKALGSARSSFEKQEPRAGLAYLAEAVRYRPNNAFVRMTSASYLLRLPTIERMPVGEPLRHGDGLYAASFSPNGGWVVTASEDKTAQVWEAASGRPVGEVMRHNGGVTAASFSPDGRWVVTASIDKTARVWEASSGRPVGLPLRHDGAVFAASFSPDGRWVVTASGDGTARVWDAASGRPVSNPLRHDERVNAASFSPDGRWVVTASIDKTARVWEAANGRPVSNPLRHDERVTAASFSPDGRWVVTASIDKTARVWEAASGRPVGAPLRHDGSVTAASFSPDGRWVVTASDDQTAKVWDAASGRPVSAPLRHDAPVFAASFSPDGRWVVTASSDKTAHMWDAASGRSVSNPLRHDGPVNAASFSPDGRWVVTASDDKTARVWEAASGRPVGGELLRHDGPVTAASFSPHGSWVVTASSDKTARVWDAASGLPVSDPLRHDAGLYAASFSPDGQWVVTASSDKTARVWDASSGRPVGKPLRHEGDVFAASFSSDSRWVVTASGDKTARVWDAASGRPVGKPLRHEGDVFAASFSSDGRWVVTASLDKTARVWDTVSGRPVGKPLRHDGPVNAASFSPDGRWVVTASLDRTARVWDAASGRPVGKPLRHSVRGTAASFSPDGRWVVTASEDGTARVWDAASGRPIGQPLRHDWGVTAASFSSDGRWVATASGDETARVWEAVSGRPVGEPLRHDGWVNAASFSPDGCWVVTASMDGSARVWELGCSDDGKEIPAALEALAGRRVSDDGLLMDVPVEERLAWRDRLLAAPSDGSEWDRLLRWHLADPRTRTISPHAALTVPQHIEREIDWVIAHPQAGDNASILAAAYSLDPLHPLILFALSAVEENPATRTWYRDLGLKRLPADARLCARAAEILKLQGDRPRALAAAEKALALDPRNLPALAVQVWARAEPAGRVPGTAAAKP